MMTCRGFAMVRRVYVQCVFDGMGFVCPEWYNIAVDREDVLNGM
jgi:hypothetical protein